MATWEPTQWGGQFEYFTFFNHAWDHASTPHINKSWLYKSSKTGPTITQMTRNYSPMNCAQCQKKYPIEKENGKKKKEALFWFFISTTIEPSICIDNFLTNFSYCVALRPQASTTVQKDKITTKTIQCSFTLSLVVVFLIIIFPLGAKYSTSGR